MGFYKRVNLTGPQGEKLQGWVAEKFADVGLSFRIAEDEKGRTFTVAEAADQLLLESQIDPRHLLNPTVEAAKESKRPKLAPAPEANGEVPKAILREPRKRKVKESASPEVQ